MKHQSIFRVVMAMALGFAVSVNADAQLGGLKNKMKSAVSKTVENKAKSEARNAAATASMSDEQRWALGQLKSQSEAPALPNLMKTTPDAYSGSSIVSTKLIKDFTEVMGKADHDKVLKARSEMDARVNYNLRVTEAFRRDAVSYDRPFDQAQEKAFQTLLDELSLFDCVQSEARFQVNYKLQDIIKRNGKMSLKDGDMIWPPLNAKSHPVRMDKGKPKFYDDESRKFITLDKDEVERVKTITLNFLNNALTLIEVNPQFEQREALRSGYKQETNLDIIDRCKLGIQLIQEALDNNGK